MLLTAQRVVSPASRQQRVNVYQFQHGNYAWQRVPPNLPLPENNPGELVRQWIELAEGGNRVISYLDVLAPDEVVAIDLQQRLASLKWQLQQRGNPTVVVWEPYWIRFGCAPNVPWQTELGALASHILLRVFGQ